MFILQHSVLLSWVPSKAFQGNISKRKKRTSAFFPKCTIANLPRGHGVSLCISSSHLSLICLYETHLCRLWPTETEYIRQLSALVLCALAEVLLTVWTQCFPCVCRLIPDRLRQSTPYLSTADCDRLCRREWDTDGDREEGRGGGRGHSGVAADRM